MGHFAFFFTPLSCRPESDSRDSCFDKPGRNARPGQHVAVVYRGGAVAEFEPGAPHARARRKFHQ